MPCVEKGDAWLRVRSHATGNKEIGYSLDGFLVGEN